MDLLPPSSRFRASSVQLRRCPRVSSAGDQPGAERVGPRPRPDAAVPNRPPKYQGAGGRCGRGLGHPAALLDALRVGLSAYRSNGRWRLARPADRGQVHRSTLDLYRRMMEKRPAGAGWKTVADIIHQSAVAFLASRARGTTAASPGGHPRRIADTRCRAPEYLRASGWFPLPRCATSAPKRADGQGASAFTPTRGGRSWRRQLGCSQSGSGSWAESPAVVLLLPRIPACGGRKPAGSSGPT